MLVKGSSVVRRSGVCTTLQTHWVKAVLRPSLKLRLWKSKRQARELPVQELRGAMTAVGPLQDTNAGHAHTGYRDQPPRLWIPHEDSSCHSSDACLISSSRTTIKPKTFGLSAYYRKLFNKLLKKQQWGLRQSTNEIRYKAHCIETLETWLCPSTTQQDTQTVSETPIWFKF